MNNAFLKDEPAIYRCRVLLAHGAGAPMDTAFMNATAHLLHDQGIAVARFEFAYMAQRREGGSRRPPPRAELLLVEYRQAILSLQSDVPLFIGGKSLGGRVASMIADEEYRAGRIAGLVCLGYPFHPPGKPEKLRAAHLETLATPTLIAQGERDPFGGRGEVAGYALSPAITIHWAQDGDHDLAPRKRSGVTREENLHASVSAIARWIDQML